LCDELNRIAGRIYKTPLSLVREALGNMSGIKNKVKNISIFVFLLNKIDVATLPSLKPYA